MESAASSHMFPLFPSLPLEIRQQVWRATFSSRIVSLYWDWDLPNSVWRLGPTTKVPVAAHVNRESRKELIRHYSRDLLQPWLNDSTVHLDDRHKAYFCYDLDVLRVEVDDFYRLRCLTAAGCTLLRRLILYKPRIMLGFRSIGTYMPHCIQYERHPVCTINLEKIIFPNIKEIWQVGGIHPRYWDLENDEADDLNYNPDDLDEENCKYDERDIFDQYGNIGEADLEEDERDDTPIDNERDPDRPRHMHDFRFYLGSNRVQMLALSWKKAMEVSRRHRWVDHFDYPRMKRLKLCQGHISRIQVVQDTGGISLHSDGQVQAEIEEYSESEDWATKKRRILWNVLAENINNTLRIRDSNVL